jgi:hypothetical protein
MPSLKERIDADLKDAMRSKDELGTSVLRMLKSAVKYKEVEPGGHALEDAGVLAVIQTLIKQRRESVEQFRAGGRPSWRTRRRRRSPGSRPTSRRRCPRDELRARCGRPSRRWARRAQGHGRGDEGRSFRRSRGVPRARRSPTPVKAELAPK